MPGPHWSDEEKALALSLSDQGLNQSEISERLAQEGYKGRTSESVGSAIRRMRHERDKHRNASLRQEVADNAARPPVPNEDLHARIRQLEETLARLQGQRVWETHSRASESSVGLLTLRRSDDHFGDENHLISCRTSLEEKFFAVVEQYQPEMVQIIGGDDWVAGRGIFKEQDLSCAVSDPVLQLHVGAVMARRFLLKLRAKTEAPIHWRWIRGNHDYLGKVSLAESQFLKARTLCEDIPNLKFTLYWDRAHLNLADGGDYWAMVYHGFGHSKTSPNSPAFIDTVKDQLIGMQKRVPAEKMPKRILSGHTHWLSVGVERVVGLHFDTTGGLQRNTRVQLGRNGRPSGWIVYVSPKGSGDIMNPIGLTPNEDVYWREIADPFLTVANRKECAEALEEYHKLLEVAGVVVNSDEFGVTEGRW